MSVFLIIVILQFKNRLCIKTAGDFYFALIQKNMYCVHRFKRFLAMTTSFKSCMTRLTTVYSCTKHLRCWPPIALTIYLPNTPQMFFYDEQNLTLKLPLSNPLLPFQSLSTTLLYLSSSQLVSYFLL